MQPKCFLSLFSRTCTHQGKGKPIGIRFHIERKDQQKNHSSREINKMGETKHTHREMQKWKWVQREYQSEGEKVGEKRSDDWWNEWLKPSWSPSPWCWEERNRWVWVSDQQGILNSKGKKHKTGHVFPSISSSLITSSAPIGVVVFFCLLISFPSDTLQSHSDTLEDWLFHHSHVPLSPLILREKNILPD